MAIVSSAPAPKIFNFDEKTGRAVKDTISTIGLMTQNILQTVGSAVRDITNTVGDSTQHIIDIHRKPDKHHYDNIHFYDK